MKKLLPILITLLLAFVDSANAKNYVICVGIRDYPGTVNDLHLSDKDASYIATLYRSIGNSEVHLITNSNATLANVKQTMRMVFKKATSYDTVIFFFSGHGYSGSFVCYDGLLKYSAITNSMKLGNARRRFVIADACLSGSMRNNNRRTEKNNDVSVMFFLSSRSEEKSAEIPWMDYSVFTYYLGLGLQGYADSNDDRTVTARELFLYVHQNVTDLGIQHPVMWGNFSDNMSIVRY